MRVALSLAPKRALMASESRHCSSLLGLAWPLASIDHTEQVFVATVSPDSEPKPKLGELRAATCVCGGSTKFALGRRVNSWILPEISQGLCKSSNGASRVSDCAANSLDLGCSGQDRAAVGSRQLEAKTTSHKPWTWTWRSLETKRNETETLGRRFRFRTQPPQTSPFAKSN